MSRALRRYQALTPMRCRLKEHNNQHHNDLTAHVAPTLRKWRL